jgi:hypothetical protein
MSDLISREALLKQLKGLSFPIELNSNVMTMFTQDVVDLITNAPAIEQGEAVEIQLAIAVEELEGIASNPSQSLMLTVYPNMDSRAHKATKALDKIRKVGE